VRGKRLTPALEPGRGYISYVRVDAGIYVRTRPKVFI
jgi:hypothetical protein